MEWHLLERAPHQGVQRLMRDLNALYRAEPALHELDTDPAGMEWIDANDSDNSVLSYVRKSRHGPDAVVVVCNFTPVPRAGYRVGVPHPGFWREILNTDAREYGGSGLGNLGGLGTDPVPFHGRRQSLSLFLPPLSVVALRCETR